MKKGDTIIAVNLVDLAITLFTLGIPFYDPLHPYIYQSLGGKKSIRFHFGPASTIPGVPMATELMQEWPTADQLQEPLSLVAIAKRTIWARRTLLKELNNSPAEMQELANGFRMTDDLRLAVVAYALGFARPEKACVTHGLGKHFYLVGEKAPAWLGCSFDEVSSMLNQGIEFIEAEGNETNPVAVAAATFLNTVAWLDHLKNDKPYVQFNTASGKSYWVKEGSDKWTELLASGYSPQ